MIIKTKKNETGVALFSRTHKSPCEEVRRKVSFKCNETLPNRESNYPPEGSSVVGRKGAEGSFNSALCLSFLVFRFVSFRLVSSRFWLTVFENGKFIL